MNQRKAIFVSTVLLVILITFGIVPDAFAKLKATAPFYLWDDVHHHFSHDIANLWLDGQQTDVIHELGFDKIPYDPTVPGSPTKEMCDRVAALNVPGNPQQDHWLEDCPEARDTIYAGVMELGVPLDKTEPEGTALVFAYTVEWSLIDCDLNSDGSWDNGDLVFNTLQNHPPLLENWDIYTLPEPTVPFSGTDQTHYFKVLAIDVVTACSMGNCDNELVTTIFLDLDINKDNKLTVAGDGVPADATGSLPSGCVCFYAKAYPIDKRVTPTAPWSGNPQARITAGGGDKTVNFNLYGPSTITLEKFSAYSPTGLPPAVWLAAAFLLSCIALLLIRGRKPGPGV